MRITRPVIGTAVGAGVLGAALTLGLTVASASTSGSAASGSSRTATATTATVPASPAPFRAHGTHKCPAGARHGMPRPGQRPGGGQSPAAGTGAAY